MSDDLQVVATALNEPEAAVLMGLLETAGISCMAQPPMGSFRAEAARRRIYVREADVSRVQGILRDAEKRSSDD